MTLESTNKDEKSCIYKYNAQKRQLDTQKSGNSELDKGLRTQKYNSMPNFVHQIVGGLAQ